MALKVGGTEVVDNNRQLKNIATIDSGTVTAFNSALNTDPTKGTLTKTFAQNETAEITLSSNVSVGPVVGVTKEVPQTGVSTKGNWDVNSTASNYDFHNTAANVTLSQTLVANANISDMTQVYDYTAVNSYGPKPSPFFKPDGTMMFICSQSNAYIYTYNLSTAWDLTTASYDGGKLFSTNAATSEGDPTDLFFKPDGTVLFVVGITQDEIRAYDLSTAWDISSRTLSSSNLMSTAGESAPKGIFFKPDGTRVYVTGGNANQSLQYDLSTAWDLSTKSSPSTFNTGVQDNSGHGIRFNSTGTKMYFLGTQNNKMYQYTLSTAWDITSASYDSVEKDFSSITSGGDPHGFFIDSTGTRIYLGCGGSGSSRIYYFSNGQDALALGSGSFASTDVGKRITGNGGDVVLTATSGTFSTTGGSAFTDSSTIAAGSWQMFGLKSAGDASGITITSGSGSGAVDIDQASETSNTYNFSGTTTQGIDVTFKPDGTKMYILDYNGNSLKEFNLSTAWDLTTASYVQDYAWNSSNYGTSTTSVAFKTDGTSFYIVNYGNDYLVQFNLNTAWDLATANPYSSRDVSGSTWGSVRNPIGLVFSPDGTKLYMNGNTDSQTVQINLTSAWAINGGHSVAHTFSTGNQTSVPTALALSSDGTKIYITEDGNQSRTFQYSLSTAYDLSTISYDNKNFRPAASSTFNGTMYGTYYRADADIFYGVGYGAHTVHEFSLQTLIQPTAQYNVAVTNTSGRIDSSAFLDINSMTAAQSAGTGTVNYAVSTDGRTTWSVNKGTDGVRPIVRNNSGTWQYNNEASTTTNGYDFSSFAYDSKFYNSPYNLNDIALSTDGTSVYYVENNGLIYSRPLSTAYDISTAGGSQSTFDQSSQDNDPKGITFKPDGTKMYIVGDQNDAIFEYDLSTAFDITSASYNNKSKGVSGQSSNTYKVKFKSDGLKMYVLGNSTYRELHEFTLSTAWDVSSATYTNNKINMHSNLGSPTEGQINSFALNSDGTKIYASGNDNDKVYVWDISTAYDLSTASHTTGNNYSLQSGNARGLIFANDGTKMYEGDFSNGYIRQYSTGTTVAAYNTTPTWANGTVNDELYTLQQALSVTMNRMDKTQLDAVADANHFATGSSLDLMIALRMDAAASTLPTSDGVTLNYDSASLNEGAVLGTDYDFFHPAANKVQIKSLAAQNLKVRVV